MKRISLFIAITVICSTFVCGQSSPSLPREIRNQLETQFPGWQLARPNGEVIAFFSKQYPKANPSFIRGDFDGNGTLDYAMLIEHPNSIERGKAFTHLVEVLAFLKTGRTFKRIRLEGASPANDEVYLNLMKKGTVGGEFSTGKRFTYPNDSISLSYYEKAGGTYIWRNGKFRYVTESD